MKKLNQQLFINQIELFFTKKNLIYNRVDLNRVIQIIAYWEILGVLHKEGLENHDRFLPELEAWWSANESNWIRKLYFRFSSKLSFRSDRSQVSSKADLVFYVDSIKQLNYISSIAKELGRNNQKVVILTPARNHNLNTAFPNFDIQFLYSRKIHGTSYASLNFPFICEKYEGLLHQLQQISPRKVIVIEGDSVNNHLIGIVAKELFIESICLQWGFFGTEVPKIGWQKMPYDYFYSWGSFFSSTFQDYNPNVKFKNVGYFNSTSTEMKDSSQRNVVLFAFQQPLIPSITENDLDNLVEFVCSFAKIYPDTKIRVRNHPSAPFSNFILSKLESSGNVEVHRSNNYKLADSFENVLVCASICSTLTLESIIYGSLPVYLAINSNYFIAHDLIRETGFGYVIRDIYELGELISMSSLNKQLEDLTLNKNNFYSKVGMESMTEIIENILG